MSDFRINIVPFKLINRNANICFSSIEKENYLRVFHKNLPLEFLKSDDYEDQKFYWFCLDGEPNDIKLTVDLELNQRFAKYYLNKLIYDHFSKNFIVNHNFINDTEVYIPIANQKSSIYKEYDRFSLRIDINNLVSRRGILITYEGVSQVYNKNISELSLSNDKYNYVIWSNYVSKLSEIGNQIPRTELNPILSNSLRKILHINFSPRINENRYEEYYSKIENFYRNYLQDQKISNQIQFYNFGFINIDENNIHQTRDDSNQLLFGNNNRHFNPYIGIKRYGPLQGPELTKKVKLFFVFNNDDKELANKLYSYFRNGYKSFPGLEAFAEIKFDLDKEKTIRFSGVNPLKDVKEALKSFTFDDGTRYAAIYISEIDKNEDDPVKHRIYYQIKEILLTKNVTSQVIFRDNINDPYFNYYLPNIAVALLAKLDGIPWRLYRPIKNDLVIGIGATRKFNGDVFIGSAFCFSNNGKFNKFSAYSNYDVNIIASSIKNSVKQFIEENQDISRVIIHYYKKLSRAEEQPIIETLNNLNLKVPYIVISITQTESKDYVLFDTSFDGLMPKSGTYINIRKNQYLLCNNSRYSNKTPSRIEGFPFPIKLEFSSQDYQILTDDSTIQELIDQVYQFSRMYWKSVTQRNLPVTIEYPKIIADMVSNFDDCELGQFGNTTLWFL